MSSAVSPKPKQVVIIGGGLAGLAAAEALSRGPSSAAHELEVVLLESRLHFGGRTGSFSDPNSEQQIDYCQHVAMGCCTNFLDLMQRMDLLEFFHHYRELHFLHPDYRACRFRPTNWLPAPLHLLPAFRKLRHVSTGQKVQIAKGMWRLFRTPSNQLRDVNAQQWLIDHGQDASCREQFWDVILISALGESPEHVSMQAARKVFVDGFAATHAACDLYVPGKPLAELFGQLLVEKLADRGVQLLNQMSVQNINQHGHVSTAQQTWQPDAVICAVPWHQLQNLCDNSDLCYANTEPQASTDRLSPTQFPTSAISGIHLWFDQPITELDHAVLVGTQSQWLFRDPTEQSLSADGEHYYQVVISASASLRGADRQHLTKTILAELATMFPKVSQARLLRHRLVTDPKSVYSLTTQVDQSRPQTRTKNERLFLAGDWVQTGWPATMEGAVISGRQAAQACLESLANRKATSSDSIKSLVVPQQQPKLLSRLLIRS